MMIRFSAIAATNYGLGSCAEAPVFNWSLMRFRWFLSSFFLVKINLNLNNNIFIQSILLKSQ
ncbi:MAG: hypothetical protein ACI9SD_001935 [Pseudohongiellaceae bacterium]|jgi:hypothetical protein